MRFTFKTTGISDFSKIAHSNARSWKQFGHLISIGGKKVTDKKTFNNI